MGIIVHCDICGKEMRKVPFAQKNMIGKRNFCPECDGKIKAFDDFIQKSKDKFTQYMKAEFNQMFESAKQELRQQINSIIQVNKEK